MDGIYVVDALKVKAFFTGMGIGAVFLLAILCVYAWEIIKKRIKS